MVFHTVILNLLFHQCILLCELCICVFSQFLGAGVETEGTRGRETGGRSVCRPQIKILRALRPLGKVFDTEDN